jgi:tetratricopeptide (TPR) repeat protein
VFVEGAPPHASYRFKHALIQDAAYDSLLKSRRQALHRRAAEALRDASAEPEAIAHHFTEAGLDDLAIEWWGKAGDQALRRSAFQEAIAHLGKAIEMADKAAAAANANSSRDKPSRRVKLQSDYAQAVVRSKGWAADETKAAFERTGELAARAELPSEWFSAHLSQAVWSIQRGQVRAGRSIAERFLRDAEAEGRIAEVGRARQVLGSALLFLGDLAAARGAAELALESSDIEIDSEVKEKYLQEDPVFADSPGTCFVALGRLPSRSPID